VSLIQKSFRVRLSQEFLILTTVGHPGLPGVFRHSAELQRRRTCEDWRSHVPQVSLDGHRRTCQYLCFATKFASAFNIKMVPTVEGDSTICLTLDHTPNILKRKYKEQMKLSLSLGDWLLICHIKMISVFNRIHHYLQIKLASVLILSSVILSHYLQSYLFRFNHRVVTCIRCCAGQLKEAYMY
jgi:hypothetical protein